MSLVGRFSTWILLIAPIPLGAQPVATPICSREYELVPVDPTYYPGEALTFSFRPKSADWISTPTLLGWRVDEAEHYVPETTLTVVPDETWGRAFLVSVAAFGPASKDGCPAWTTTEYASAVRRFDVSLTPSPSPSPIFPPSPTPCPVRCEQVESPMPDSDVVAPGMDVIVREPGVPLSLIAFDDAGSVSHLHKVGPEHWRTDDLLPNKRYELMYLCGYDCFGEPQIGLILFNTIEAPTPSPSPLATPPPAPAPQVNGWVLSEAEK